MVEEYRYKILTFLTYPGSRKPRAVPVGLHKYNVVSFNVPHDIGNLFSLVHELLSRFHGSHFLCPTMLLCQK
jgi:hypothetical protein